MITLDTYGDFRTADTVPAGARSFAATQSGPSFRPVVGGFAWLVRTEYTELVQITQVTERSEACAVIPVRPDGLPVTALFELLHATEADALNHLEHRASQIYGYVQRSRAELEGKEDA